MAELRRAFCVLLCILGACGDSAREPAPKPDSGAITPGGGDPPGDVEIPKTAPTLVQLDPHAVDEEQTLVVPVGVDMGELPTRMTALNLPPGALWNARDLTVTFRPDFTQGGQTYTITLVAENRLGETQTSFDIVVNDTVTPPEPDVSRANRGDFVILTVSQSTDAFLAGPGLAGTRFPAVITVPRAALEAPERSYPVRVMLHGYGAELVTTTWAEEIRIHPYDPLWTLFWGYSSSLPNAADGQNSAPYTQRRIIHLLDWTLRTFPAADPDRAYVVGSSMGGVGAMSLGLLQQRHFAFADSRSGATIARFNNDNWERQDLQLLFGSISAPLNASTPTPWDILDMTRVLRDEPLSRDQLLFTEHSKGDNIVNFASVVRPSPLTCLRFFDAMEAFKVGHYAVWHEGGHLLPDPTLGDGWWRSDTYNPVHQGPGLVRRDMAFVAFSGSSCNQDPGDGSGDGTVDWQARSGYARPNGLSGWSGDDAGAQNRFLEWDSASLLDDLHTFVVPLRVLSGDGAPSGTGQPSRGDWLDCALPVTVDVTPRRAQRFLPNPGEIVTWRFGDQEGEVIANDDGSVTIVGLPLGTTWRTLVLTRPQVPVFRSPTPLLSEDPCSELTGTGGAPE